MGDLQMHLEKIDQVPTLTKKFYAHFAEYTLEFMDSFLAF